MVSVCCSLVVVYCRWCLLVVGVCWLLVFVGCWLMCTVRVHCVLFNGGRRCLLRVDCGLSCVALLVGVVRSLCCVVVCRLPMLGM